MRRVVSRAVESETDVLLKFCEGCWEDMRHIEEQRATITNIIITVSAVIVGFIGQQGFQQNMIPIALFLIAMGVCGAVMVEKLYERHQFLQMRLNKWYEKIDEINQSSELLLRRTVADEMHDGRFPILTKMQLHVLWMSIHIAISLFGVFVLFLIVFKLR